MKRHVAMVALAALALAGCGGAGSNDANNAAAAGNAADATAAADANAMANGAAPTARTGAIYVRMLSHIDEYDVEAARLVLEKSRNVAVRELAQKILDDHEAATRNLAAAAAAAEPPIDATPQLTEEEQADLAALRGASPGDVDRLYLDQQVEAHEEALGLVTDYAANGDVDGLRRHAASVATTIQQHLARARELVVQAAAPPS